MNLFGQYFCIFGAVMSFFIALPSWEWPDFEGWMLIFLTGILGFSGQVTMTSAYKYCTTTIGGILSMSASVFSFILGVFFLGENFIFIDVIAILLIIIGTMMVVSTNGEKKE